MAIKPPSHLVIQPDPPFKRLQKAARQTLSKLTRGILLQFGCCLLIIVLNVGLLLLPGSERIENFFHDYFFRFRKTIATHPSIVMIEIAEDSIQGIGRWPWPRQYHAVMTHLLTEWGAKAIVFDMIFSEPNTEFDDGAFIESLKKSKDVYIPVVSEAKGSQKIWIHALPQMEKEIRATGHINIQPDSDGTLRRIRPIITDAGETHTHLAVQVAYDSLNKDPRKVSLPLDSHGNFIVNWAGKWKDTYKHYSYAELLKSFEAVTQGEQPMIKPEEIKDKICIIGLTAFGHTDIKANPIEPAYPAVGIHANVINSILTNQFIKPSSILLNMFSVFALGLAVTILFMRSQSAGTFILGLGLGIAWMFVSYAFFRRFGILLGVAHQLITILSLYIFCTVHALVMGRRERARLFNLATRDGLTGLYVIRHFRQIMAQAVVEAKANETPLSMILMDIDHFKKVNDTHGHPGGDMVLKKIAKIVSEQIRENREEEKRDYAGRYGGEEFIILLKNCSIPDAFFKVAGRIRRTVEAAEFEWNGASFKVTVSMGIASLGEGEQSVEAMIQRADEALYKAKNEGRNCIRLKRAENAA